MRWDGLKWSKLVADGNSHNFGHCRVSGKDFANPILPHGAETASPGMLAETAASRTTANQGTDFVIY